MQNSWFGFKVNVFNIRQIEFKLRASTRKTECSLEEGIRNCVSTFVVKQKS